jgi:hypothetical protein
MVVAISAFQATFGLVIVFFVIFPAVITGLIAFAAAQALGERTDNHDFAREHRLPGS